jgi:predicted transcriptional regulator
VNRLGDLEHAVMDVLWHAEARKAEAGQASADQGDAGQADAGQTGPGLTVRQVSGRLADRDLAHTTVMTVLDRLAKKGFARRERDGRAWRYRPTASPEAYVAGLMFDALAQTGDRCAALARFAQSVSDDEAQVLRNTLAARMSDKRSR